MNDRKVIKSYYGVDIESTVIEQNSNVLVVLLQGIGYTLDLPLLYYSKILALEKGYDVLPIECGFQSAGEKLYLDDEEGIRILIDESYELLKMSLCDKYEKLIFIGKSIGTFVQRNMEARLKSENYKSEITNIYLTPIDKTYELGIEAHSLVVSGTKDRYIRSGYREKMMNRDDIKYIEIKDAGHSLNIKGDVNNSIKVLERIISAENEFI